MAAVVPLAGALCDAIENGLEMWMLLNRPTDDLARLAATISNAKYVALVVGTALLMRGSAGGAGAAAQAAATVGRRSNRAPKARLDRESSMLQVLRGSPGESSARKIV